ncbi:hypothetical protein BJX70DRAFT_371648, partial [Aspergillus crustosus]
MPVQSVGQAWRSPVMAGWIVVANSWKSWYSRVVRSVVRKVVRFGVVFGVVVVVVVVVGCMEVGVGV